MKRIIAVFCFLMPLCSQGQYCAQPFLGSKTLYTAQQKKYTSAPRGYLPVFINHVGRHGARHLTKPVGSYYIYSLLMHADSINGLNADGKLLKEKILLLNKVETGLYKSISAKGMQEQSGLADRMFKNNKNVFDIPKPVIHVSYTREIRTLQTFEAFLKELKTKINEPIISKGINDTALRFYDMSPSYTTYEENGKWQLLLKQLKDSLHYNEITKEVTSRFFIPAFFKNLTYKNQEQFASDLFGFITIFYSIQKEIIDAEFSPDSVNMQSLLTCAQLNDLEKIDNAEDYFVKGPGENIDGIQVKIALPLLADFINTTDDFIRSKEINAQLRFCHAETISPFAALLGLVPAAASTNKITDIDKVWNAGKVIPLSSNIQWILYKKNGQKNYLIKFLLNEKEVAVNGLKTKTFPYYDWNDVRSFYVKKISAFNASVGSNFVQYLKDVD